MLWKNIIGFISILIYFILMFLQVLFFTAFERKILALTQRRLGPHHVGDRGRLQYFADAIKLILKNISTPKNVPKFAFQGSSILAFWLSWFSFSNITFAPGNVIWNIEYNVFFFIICSQLFSLVWLIAGWASTSRYALLGAIRASIQIISYEIFSSLVFFFLILLTGTINFDTFIIFQLTIPVFIICPAVGLVFFIGAFIETNRPPFDLSEAESDVVAGYLVEFGGLLFGLFYLAEYINIFTNSMIITLLFFGGWADLLRYIDYFLKFLLFFF